MIAIDLRGFGGSEKPASGYSMEDQAGLVAQALRRLGVRKATVVGHPGGTVATALAERSPDLVARLVIVDQAPDESYGLRALPFRDALLRTGDRRRPLAGDPDVAVKDGLGGRSLPATKCRTEFVEDFNRMTYTSYTSDEEEGDYSNAMPLDRRIARAGTPLLAIFGAEDQIYDAGKALAAYARVAWKPDRRVPGAGHSLFNVEKPLETSRAPRRRSLRRRRYYAWPAKSRAESEPRPTPSLNWRTHVRFNDITGRTADRRRRPADRFRHARRVRHGSRSSDPARHARLAIALARGKGPDIAAGAAAGTLPPVPSEPEEVSTPQPQAAERSASPRGRRRRRLLIAAAALIVLVLVVGGLVAWHFSSVVLVPDHSASGAQVDVKAVSPGRITRPLRRSRPAGRLRARLGAGTCDRRDPEQRRRRRHPPPQRREWLSGPRHRRGLRFRCLRGSTQYRARSAIDHGKRQRRTRADAGLADWPIARALGDRCPWHQPRPQAGLRVAPTLHRAGLPTLLISYREDLGRSRQSGRPSPQGLTGGSTCRPQSAMRSHGAPAPRPRRLLDGRRDRRPVHGALSPAESCASRSSSSTLRPSGLGNDPVIFQRDRTKGLPSFAAAPVEWVVGARIDADWVESLDALKHPEDFHVPILLFHGTEDKTVPISTSEEFAAELPQWVTFYRVPQSGPYAESWNVGPRLSNSASRGSSGETPERNEPDRPGRARRGIRTGGDFASQEVALRVPSALSGLNFSVRNGKRCFPAMRHRKFARPPRWSLKTAQGLE